MPHYLTKENCTIEKKHYAVLTRFVNAWEEAFWNDKPEQKLLTNSARYYAGILLFKAYNEIAANTLDYLYNRELAQINPPLGWSAELATNEIKEKADVRGYLSYFDAGFREIYHRCIDEKSTLLQYLERFSACKFRCLIRNTNDYAKLLRGLYSVKVLSSENYRDERVKSLKTALGQSDEKQRAVAEEEINSLLRGDVPIFHCIADSKDLYSGEKCVARDFFGQTIEENVRYRIDNLTENECEFVLSIIHQSLRCAHIPANKPHNKAACELLSFAEEAGKAFDEIWKNRLVCPPGKSGWLNHLTDGMGEGGIAAFSTEFYTATGDARAEQVIRDFMEKFSGNVSQLCSTGNINPLADYLGITNLGGAIKAALIAARALDSKKYAQTAVEAARLLGEISPDKISLVDYYSGISGFL